VRDPGLLIFGVFCVYPLVFFALPAFLLGRYRIKVRSPVQIFPDRSGPTARPQQTPIARKLQRTEDQIEYGSGK